MNPIPHYRLCIFTAVCIFAQLLPGQQLIVNTEDGLYEIDVENCSQRLLTPLDVVLYDISFHPNGNLYGITFSGELIQINPQTGEFIFIYDFPGNQYNTLTTDASGFFYTLSPFALFRYDLEQTTAEYLGNPDVMPSGDLTFFEGELYAAILDNRIVRIDLDDVANPILVVDQELPALLTSIVLFPADCEEMSIYALTASFEGFEGEPSLYLINLEESSYEFICPFPLNALGGASTLEFWGSSPLEVVDFTAGYPNCDLNGRIRISVVGGEGELSYQRFDGPLQASGLFENMPLGIHEITVFDEIGCSITREIEMDAPIELGIDSVVFSYPDCDPDVAVLNVSAYGAHPLSYSSDGGMTFSPDSLLAVLGSGLYEVWVRDGNGCTRFIRTTVGMLSPVVIRDIELTTGCMDSLGTVVVSATSGSGGIEYTLGGSDFNSDSTFSDVLSGVYNVVVRDAFSCYDTVPDLRVAEPLSIGESEILPTSCSLENGLIRLSGRGGEAPYFFSLNGQAFLSADSFLNLAPGTYGVQVIDAADCMFTGDSVTINASLPLRVSSLRTMAVDCQDGSGGVSLRFPPGQPLVTLSINDDIVSTNGTISGIDTGRYLLNMTDERGCRLDTSFVLYPDDCDVYFPTGFSPNADGVNDLFQPYLADGVVAEIKAFRIFDRWGGLVYERQNTSSDIIELGWDGTSKEKAAGAGVYVYTAELRFVNGYVRDLKGSFSLLR